MKNLKFWEGVILLLLLYGADRSNLEFWKVFIVLVPMLFAFDEMNQMNKEK